MNYDANEKLKTEKVVSKIEHAMDFLGQLIEHVDDVDAILMDLAKYYDADRAYVFEFSEDGATLDNTYEWCREGITPQIDVLQNIPYESVSLWVEEFENVGAFFISSLDQDVDENSLTYQILEPQGIESLIAAPIYRDNKIIGFVGVDNPHEKTENVYVLKTTASIFYSEMSRKIASKNRELVRIRDIIASANMGIWRIELIDGEEPKMFADNTMKRLLGIEGRELSPQKIYDEWFYNITDEAVSSVLNSVERMQQGHFDENTYLWKHPTKGVRYVRCGGTAKPIEGGYSIQGYHYDVDEVVRRNQAQMLRLKKALEDKKEYYDTLGALGDIFYSLHVIDLTNDTVTALSAKNEVKDIVNSKTGAALMMRQVISTVTAEENKEAALEFTDLKTIAQRMGGSMVLSREFLGKNVGWYLASFILMEKDETGIPKKVVFSTRIIDAEKKQKEQLIHKSQTDELTGLLNRRAYEETIYEHNDVPSEDDFVYVALDANGLKVVNDTIGHAAGDELLVGLSQCMKNSLGPYGKLYRIGGDEFVSILYCSDDMIEDILADFDKTVANWKGEIIDHLTVSYGWVSKNEMPDASTRQLGVVAEKRMYKAKSDYYRKQGVDRRGQQDAHKVLCELYAKILKINITDDTYQIINMDESEYNNETVMSEKISKWLISFGENGMVHPDDISDYKKMTDIDYMREYFGSGKTSLHVFYRRNTRDGFKRFMMEIVPATDYKKDSMSLFLYVKNID